jgi:hypothetical protein
MLEKGLGLGLHRLSDYVLASIGFFVTPIGLSRPSVGCDLVSF